MSFHACGTTSGNGNSVKLFIIAFSSSTMFFMPELYIMADKSISDLCPEMVIMIITFLSLPDAMNLCSLCRSWHHLWSHCRIIELDETSFPTYGDGELVVRSRFIEYVKRVISRLDAPTLSKFSLRVGYEPQYHKLIEDWIWFATVRKVEELNLDFSVGTFIMPEFFSRLGGSIKFLILKSCYLVKLDFQSFVSLSKVSFSRIEISMTDVLNLVTNCPLLEDFSLVQCSGLLTVILKLPRMKLKRLVVKDCEPLSLGIELTVPNLRYFEYSGGLVRFDLRHLDRIEEAILDYDIEIYFNYQILEIKHLIRGLKQVRILKLCSYVYKVFPTEYHFFHEPPVQLENLVHLTVKTCMESYELPGIMCFLACAPNLRYLSIISGFTRSIDDFLYFNFPLMPDGFWMPPKWPLNCLEMVEMMAFSADNYEMDLLKFLLRNGVVLQKVIIKPKQASEKNFQAILGLQNVEKASETVQIVYESMS
ncbi:hypothetical protein NE237_031504 [Protea cynaroides]|uniref:F-box domain-containing protein n=1 Tax=Protea cynaroides TaxID=273540 RepID=A0A9Q0R2K5_9MAGN|nr:hypothetical protein NE237_031504 [Protea cynaroides]